MITALALTLSLLAPAAPPEILAVHAARLLDVRSGRIVHDALVVIEGDRIRAAGPSSEVTVPAGARRIELGDRTLLPGLMDLHVHLSLGSPKARRGESLFNGPIDNAFMAADNARLTLDLGFTTVRSAGENDFIDVALDKAIEKGVAVGPRIVPAGCQISMTGGHGDDTGWPPGVFEYGPEQGIADGPEKLLRAVRYQIKHGARVIKMMVSGGVTGFEAKLDVQQFSPEEMRTVVEEAARNGLKVMAHSHSLAAHPRRGARRRRLDRARHGARRRGGAPDEGARHLPGADAAGRRDRPLGLAADAGQGGGGQRQPAGEPRPRRSAPASRSPTAPIPGRPARGRTAASSRCWSPPA